MESDAVADAPKDLGLPESKIRPSLACGGQTCTASQYCVIPCCGNLACLKVQEDGKCPPGTTFSPNAGCFGSATLVCAPPCLQYPLYCVDKSAVKCSPNVNCLLPPPPWNAPCSFSGLDGDYIKCWCS